MPPGLSLARAELRTGWAAIWNLASQTDEQGLLDELGYIDFVPEKISKVSSLDGAYLLGYSKYPFLADALPVALNETRGHLKDNGDTIRVVKHSRDEKDKSPVPAEVQLAFDRLEVMSRERV